MIGCALGKGQGEYIRQFGQFEKKGAFAVIDGLKPGEQVVSSGTFKLRNGAAVQVNNSVQPANSPAPKPEDN